MPTAQEIQRKKFVGYCAGIVAGVSYGTNPLFAKPLMESGVPVLVMLFFRYGISALLLAGWMLMKGETFHNFTETLPLFAIPMESGKYRRE